MNSNQNTSPHVHLATSVANHLTGERSGTSLAYSIPACGTTVEVGAVIHKSMVARHGDIVLVATDHRAAVTSVSAVWDADNTTHHIVQSVCARPECEMD